MTFHQALEEHYPGAMREPVFVHRAYDVLARLKFDHDNTLACVATCRDELTHTLVHEVQQAWGEPFNLTSLAGLLTAGRAGFSQLRAHGPTALGRERFLFCAVPHIAIDETGTIGQCTRDGGVGSAVACESLDAFMRDAQVGAINTAIDQTDIEKSMLAVRLHRRLVDEPTPSLLTVTRWAYEAILEDLERLVAGAIDRDRSDYAVLAGIQIHGPRGNYIWPGKQYAMVNGLERSIDLSIDRDGHSTVTHDANM